MAKVSLRIYNREIEAMVDRGQLDEAVAHCRHILNAFPKNLETYRVLGKAYLEARRYEEATDIFNRLLMAVPDDFVAHVGMSIINDEQNEMDAAIWHMERAFEVQPSNAAIQAELQRLFGRRDGVEPPKVRLTRGALAHMYVQGELYPQAISEIEAVLEEDRERQDMQVLLALAYFRAGQKNEAAEMCSQLLRRYPYCFDANRVLVELLPETERGENPQVYRHRVNELDPYATFTTGSVFHTEEVPDAAVSLERLEWDGQPVELGEGWGETSGISLGEGTTTEEEEPDWLKTAMTSEGFSASLPTEEPDSASGNEDDIPEFLREAGWGKDTGTFQESPGTFAASDEPSEELPLAEGELPDWIKAMAPTGANLESSANQNEPVDDQTGEDVPDWLQDLDGVQDSSGEEQEPLAEGDIPDWLAAMKPSGETQQEPQPENEMIAESAGGEEVSDWIAALESNNETPPETQPGQEEEQMPEFSNDEDLPDWLKAAQAEEQESTAQEVPGEESSETPQEPLQDFPEVSNESLSDWQTGEEETAGAVDFDATDTGALGASAAEQDDAIAWLEGLAAKHGAKPEELVTKPEERTETEPEWVQQARAAKEQEAADTPVPQEEPGAVPSDEMPEFLASMQVEPTEMPSAPVDAGPAGPSAEEQDDAIAWLENLAAKHGAKPEELVTDPNARKESAPEWVQKAAEASDAAQVPAEAATPSEEPLESIPDWIEPTAEEAETPSSELEDTKPHAPVSRSTDQTGMWLRSLDEEGGSVEEQEPAGEAESQPMDEGIPDWLREMEESAPKAEAGSTSESETQEVPDWLSGMEETPSEAEVATPSEGEAQEVPEWLSGIEETPTEAEEPSQTGEETLKVPDWLSEMEETPSAAEEISTSEEEAQEEASQRETVPPSAEETPESPDWFGNVEEEPLISKPGTAPLSPGETPEVPYWLQDVEAKPLQGESSSDETAEEEMVMESGQEVIEKIDLNTASIEQLAALPGIGDLLAQDIIAHREAYGAFSSVEDLSNIAGIGPATIEELRGRVEFRETEADITGWLESVETEETGAAVEETTSDDLPAWLAGLEEETAQPEAVESADEGLPEWLRTVDEQEPVQAEPTAAMDWQPADTETAAPIQEETSEPATEPEAEREAPIEAAPAPAPEPPAPARQPYREPVTRSRSGMTGMLSSTQDPVLAGAQIELTRGNISDAMENYGKLIKKGKMLEEIIFDLREALYRYPVDVFIMQTLGDAYMRANQLQDALDAYTKAEELLR